MHHEHDGHCCQQEMPQLHEHHHAAVPLGHICTGACMHEAAEASALAMLREQQAEIDQFQSRTFETVSSTKNKDKKTKRKRSNLGTLGLAPYTLAA